MFAVKLNKTLNLEFWSSIKLHFGLGFFCLLKVSRSITWIIYISLYIILPNIFLFNFCNITLIYSWSVISSVTLSTFTELLLSNICLGVRIVPLRVPETKRSPRVIPHYMLYPKGKTSQPSHASPNSHCLLLEHSLIMKFSLF